MQLLALLGLCAAVAGAADKASCGSFEFLEPPQPDPAELAGGVDCPHHEAGLVEWGDAVVPGADTVVLPNATKVVVGAASIPPGFVYRQIIVPATSELIFRDEAMALTANAIVVFGKLRMGSPACRLRGPIEVTFTGQRDDPPSLLHGAGSKGMAVLHEGEVDMFAQRFFPTWTRLAHTAAAGTDEIHLTGAVNWEPGQEVAVLTTIADDSGATTQPQNEVRVIKAVDATRKVVTLNAPLAHRHYAGEEYRGEVALLSRQIALRGTPDAEGYGGHVIVHGRRGRFAGVESQYMGQTNLLGKYPFHLHRLGGGTGSLLSDNVARDTYFRCFTIHGTSDVHVQENIGFNATGSCYYLEDGLETNVTFRHNLAAHIQPIGLWSGGATEAGETIYQDAHPGGLTSGDRVLPKDASASGFFISNNNNAFVGNTASGGFAGFAVVSYPAPIGADRFVNATPNALPLTLFIGNTAHSTGWPWGYSAGVYVGGELTYADAAKTQFVWRSGRTERDTTLHINNTLVWGARRGVTSWASHTHLEHFDFVDVWGETIVAGNGYISSGTASRQSLNAPSAAYPDAGSAAYFAKAAPPPRRGDHDASCVASTRAGYDCMVPVLKGAYLHWTRDGTSLQIRLAVTSATSGWLAVGFPAEAGRMTRADAVVLSDAGVQTYRVDTYKDVHQDAGVATRLALSAPEGTWGAGTSVLEFTRSAKGFDGTVAVNIARDPESRVFGRHAHEHAAGLVVNFRTGGSVAAVEDRSQTRLLHAWLMVIAWCFLAPAGVLLKRYGKTVFGLGNSTKGGQGSRYGAAFIGHVGLMLLAVAFATTGFVLAAKTLRRGRPPATDAHGAMGYAIFAFVVLLPCVGAVMPLVYPTAEGQGRAVTKLLHVWGGRACMVACYVQVFLGVQRLQDLATEGHAAVMLAATAGLAAAVSAGAVMEVLHRLYVVELRHAGTKPLRFAAKKVRAELVQQHHGAASDDPWVVVAGRVFAIKDWMAGHPGGQEVLREAAGGDATDMWRMFRHSTAAMTKMEQFYIGEIEDSRMVDATDLVGEIASALVVLDLPSARAFIARCTRDASVPPALLGACEQLVENLPAYSPYLPQSIVPATFDGARSPGTSQEVDPQAIAHARAAAALDANPPTELAVAFTDIQSSTALWEACPEGMTVGLAMHNIAIRRVITAVMGYEIKTIGDAFMVAFLRAESAFQFALKVQEALVEVDWPEELLASHPLCMHEAGGSGPSGWLWSGPRVRIGAHWGTANPQRSPVTNRIDFFGNAVNKAARVESIGVGGCSAVTEELMSHVADVGDAVTIPLGKVPLKGVSTDKLSHISLIFPASLAQRQAVAHGTIAQRDNACGAKDSAKSPKAVDSFGRRRVSLSSCAPEPLPTFDGRSVAGSYQSTGLLPALKVRGKGAFSASMSTVATVSMNGTYLRHAEDLAGGVEAYLVPLITAATRTEGVVHSVNGSTVVLSWNLAKRAEHTLQSLNFLVEVHRLGRAFLAPCEVWGGAMSIGVASGWALQGRVGMDTHRSVTILGGTVELSAALAHLASARGLFATTAAMPEAAGVQGEPSAADAYRLIDRLPLRPSPPAASEVHRALQAQVPDIGPMRFVDVYEVNVVALSLGKGTWGFELDGPEDSTWGPAFCKRAALVFDAFARDAAEGAAAAVTLREDLAAVKAARACPCGRECAVVWCQDCERQSCAMCTAGCVEHDAGPHPSGSWLGVEHLDAALTALSATRPSDRKGLALQMHYLTQRPPAAWLAGGREANEKFDAFGALRSVHGTAALPRADSGLTFASGCSQTPTAGAAKAVPLMPNGTPPSLPHVPQQRCARARAAEDMYATPGNPEAETIAALRSTIAAQDGKLTALENRFEAVVASLPAPAPHRGGVPSLRGLPKLLSPRAVDRGNPLAPHLVNRPSL